METQQQAKRVAPLTPKQQAQRDDIRRRYQAIVAENARRERSREDLEHRVLMAIINDTGVKWRNIHELRRVIGDEREPGVWDRLSPALQHHYMVMIRREAERLAAALKSAPVSYASASMRKWETR